ncbi:E3 ubiquitin-protein ligase RNF182 isoform X1 [Corythoichthys intestinalis]|uniref:E3 ubiquitin-protein ligase RNF182 isoform X1 n=1 Tax=Corythoichthys intestinalis TaxID=161448 RepID=UPI0025A5740C|nr:E3 ubiquitin-protein ligase RNF182 isoform X1 [Corythoichthys intestinalis]XP_057701053.1 E3 ubiquitin-protein ligase RNF182 isoform X1 [Corythoichthys intestinalis]XP_057701054.1 E3 ubiquitin-protein ligase RNF182 isoform X1 [Corythoichthys intestinalis]XP_057701055.1 E3 ubiquitin-protein ligase RNF182 isoform X1 [Corythoichthys intestinalis]XP_057701056.1 E3 ubiquitin-protein ligase RNF182 isoform X1 [Corythoichthys intestinalis]XP_057701057.1 E3 ubiquitin-protein ligase RNF182 isoform X1
MSRTEGAEPVGPPDECRICYDRYDTRGRKPKLLACLHRVCAKCLKRMLDVGQSSPCVVTCPFCRGKTSVPPEEVWGTEDERRLLAVLSRRDRGGRRGDNVEPGLGDVLPDGARPPSDGLLITVAELPAEWPSPDSPDGLNAVALYRRAGRDSLAVPRKCDSWTRSRVPRCLLGTLCLAPKRGTEGWASTAGCSWTYLASCGGGQPLCASAQVYFGSLPVGLYLLMLAHTWAGVLLVSLVPSTLILLVLYGCCECLSHQLLEALAARRRNDDGAVAIASVDDD